MAGGWLSPNASQAVRDLDVAVEKGFRRFEIIASDTDFDPIRNDDAFRKWMAAHTS